MAKGGFGGGSWGGGAWGGSSGAEAPSVVYETVTVSEGLSAVILLRVLGAQAIEPALVRVDFNQPLDYDEDGPTLDPTNFAFPSGPSLTVWDVAPGTDPKSVIIQTSDQSGVNYTLEVVAALSAFGEGIDPLNNTDTFPGWPIIPAFFATAQSDTKVQLTFSTEMVQNAAFSDPTNYTVTTVSGTPIVVNSATPSGPTPITRVVLELASGMDPGAYYAATIDTAAGIQASNGEPFLRDSSVFQWAQMLFSGPISINIDNFSGEVTGGLLGQPAGQIFFSPALDVAAADSSIQLDEVSLCTRAYDTYTPPSLPDPGILMTFGGVVTTLLNDADKVLYATAERLGLFRANLVDTQAETMPTAVDGPADAELVETIDANKAGFLNVPGYTLFPGNSFSVNSLVFDAASSQYAAVGNVAPTQFDRLSTFSLVCQFKSAAVGLQTLMGKREDGGTNRGYQFLLDGGKLRARLVNNGGSDEIDVITDNTFNDGIFHQAVLVYSGSGTAAGVTIFVDGLPVATTTVSDTLTATILDAVGFNIGAIGTVPTEFLTGNLDDCGVYSIALSPAEVLTIYNADDPPDLASVGPFASLVGYWRMGEGATFPTIPDDSVNANPATMTNMLDTDIVSAASGVFIVAANLTAVGPGPTATINLQP